MSLMSHVLVTPGVTVTVHMMQRTRVSEILIRDTGVGDVRKKTNEGKPVPLAGTLKEHGYEQERHALLVS